MLKKLVHWPHEKPNRLERINEIVLAKDRNFPIPDKG